MQVLIAIADNCDRIKYLDLWRAKTLTSEGLSYLASKSHQLVSLDIGKQLTQLKVSFGFKAI